MLADFQRFLAKTEPADVFYTTVLRDEHTVSVALQLGDVAERLQQLKYQFIEVATKQLFVEKMAAAGAASAYPAPSVTALANAELAAETHKASLKRAKASRAAATARLDDACRAVSAAATADAAARASFEKAVVDGQAGLRLRAVASAIADGDPDAVRALAADADSQDATACERLLTHIFDELAEATRARDEAESETGRLQAKIDSLAAEQAAFNSQVTRFRAEAERNERSNKAAPALREEYARHESLYDALSALTRARTSSVYAGGIAMTISISRPVQGGEAAIEAAYQLDMDVSDRADGFVTKVTMSPPDVDVSAIVSVQRPLTLLQVAHEVVEAVTREPVAQTPDTSAAIELIAL
jgi:hypothetical protein